MGLHIVNDHPFTAEEKQYLRDRCRYDEIAQNAEINWSSKASALPQDDDDDDDVLQLDKDVYDHVVALTLKQLQAELRKVHIDPKGNEPELRTILASYLQAQKDSRGKK